MLICGLVSKRAKGWQGPNRDRDEESRLFRWAPAWRLWRSSTCACVRVCVRVLVCGRGRARLVFLHRHHFSLSFCPCEYACVSARVIGSRDTAILFSSSVVRSRSRITWFSPPHPTPPRRLSSLLSNLSRNNSIYSGAGCSKREGGTERGREGARERERVSKRLERRREGERERGRERRREGSRRWARGRRN